MESSWKGTDEAWSQHQETDHTESKHRKDREHRKWAWWRTHEAHPGDVHKWSITFPNSTTNRGPSVQIHEPIQDICQAKYHRLRGFPRKTTWVQELMSYGSRPCLVLTLLEIMHELWNTSSSCWWDVRKLSSGLYLPNAEIKASLLYPASVLDAVDKHRYSYFYSTYSVL